MKSWLVIKTIIFIVCLSSSVLLFSKLFWIKYYECNKNILCHIIWREIHFFDICLQIQISIQNIQDAICTAENGNKQLAQLRVIDPGRVNLAFEIRRICTPTPTSAPTTHTSAPNPGRASWVSCNKVSCRKKVTKSEKEANPPRCALIIISFLKRFYFFASIIMVCMGCSPNRTHKYISLRPALFSCIILESGAPRRWWRSLHSTILGLMVMFV